MTRSRRKKELNRYYSQLRYLKVEVSVYEAVCTYPALPVHGLYETQTPGDLKRQNITLTPRQILDGRERDF